MGSGQWLERYKEGERALVWHELRQAGDGVREPEFAQDAQAVCDEMARRAGHNIEMVVARLRAQGYRFHINDDEQTPVDPIHARPRGVGVHRPGRPPSKLNCCPRPSQVGLPSCPRKRSGSILARWLPAIVGLLEPDQRPFPAMRMSAPSGRSG